MPKHGHRGPERSCTYISWSHMKDRCLNPKSRDYGEYGGRGITVCEKWMEFEGFLEDMGERPPGTTIDRIDNEKGYCKENCRWADYSIQRVNQRRYVA